MSQTRTEFKIEGWEGANQKLADQDSGKLGEKVLPVIVYLCPKCGKIDFRATRKTKQELNILNWSEVKAFLV